jgi:hypothetical protein
MTKNSSVFSVAIMFTIACLMTACSDSGKQTQVEANKQVAANKQVVANKFEKSQEECANAMEVLFFCKEGGWDGNSPISLYAAPRSVFGASKGEEERGNALNHLYKNGKFSTVKDIFDARDGTCRSIIQVQGQYNGSDYSATLYCDKTNILESRLKYKREQAQAKAAPSPISNSPPSPITSPTVAKPDVVSPSVTQPTPQAGQNSPQSESTPNLAARPTAQERPPTPQPIANPTMGVLAMIAAGKSENNAAILSAKVTLDSFPKPDRGDRKLAREKNKLGLDALKENAYENAIARFNEGVAEDPSDVEFKNNLGYALMMAGKLDYAQKTLIESLALDSARGAAWANLGQTLAKQGDEDSAVAAFVNTFIFSRAQNKTVEFLTNLSQSDPDPRVKAAAAKALEAHLIKGVAVINK